MDDQVLPTFLEYSSSTESSPSFPSPCKSDHVYSEMNIILNSGTKQTARKSTNKMLTKFIEMKKDDSVKHKIRSNKTKQTARKHTSPYFYLKLKNQFKHQIVTGNI